MIFIFIEKRVQDADFVIENLEHISFQDFSSSPILTDSVCFRFIQISESGKRISDYFLRNSCRGPWPLINGLKNRLVHACGEMDLHTVYFTATYDLPELVAALKRISK